jgi:hypothetical protein
MIELAAVEHMPFTRQYVENGVWASWIADSMGTGIEKSVSKHAWNAVFVSLQYDSKSVEWSSSLKSFTRK